MRAATKSFVLIHADDAYSAGITGVFRSALPSTEMGVSIDVLLSFATLNALPAGGQAAWLTALLAPVCAGLDFVLVVLVPGTVTAPLMAAGASLCNLTGARYFWVGGDAFVDPANALRIVGGLCIAPSAANTSLATSLIRMSNSTYAPFLYDAVLTYAHAIDAAARRARSPLPAAISGNRELRMRIVVCWPRNFTCVHVCSPGFG